MKQGLTKLNEWLTKGYIPQEAALWDENKTAEPAVAGTAGIIPGPYWMSGWPLIDTVKNVPSAVWKPIAIPAGPDGKAMRHGTQFVNGVTLIKKIWHIQKHSSHIRTTCLTTMLIRLQEARMITVYSMDMTINWMRTANRKPDEIDGGYVNVVRYLLVRDGARIPDAQMKALMNLADGKEPQTKLEKT